VQGLIQLAAAGHKAFVQHQPRGCVKLLTSALGKLEAAPPDFLGIETRSFLRAVRRMLAEAKRWNDGEIAGLHRTLMPRVVLIGPPAIGEE